VEGQPAIVQLDRVLLGLPVSHRRRLALDHGLDRRIDHFPRAGRSSSWTRSSPGQSESAASGEFFSQLRLASLSPLLLDSTD